MILFATALYAATPALRRGGLTLASGTGVVTAQISRAPVFAHRWTIVRRLLSEAAGAAC